MADHDSPAVPVPTGARRGLAIEGEGTNVTHAIRTAIESRDPAALVAMSAPDIVFGSPATPTPVRGREAFAKAYEGLIKGSEKWADEWRVEHVVSDGELCHVAFGGRVLGQTLDLVAEMRFDEQNAIVEIRTYGRPMAAVAALALCALPRVARIRSRTRSIAAWLLLRPLPRTLQLGVSLGMWIAKPWPASEDHGSRGSKKLTGGLQK